MQRTVFLLLVFSSLLVSCKNRTELDKYGGHKGLKTKSTGWFEVEKIKDRWYFVTPEGHAFFSLGATHAVECLRLDELNLLKTRYQGSEKMLSDTFLAYFDKWGYNSAGYGALPSMEKKIPYVVEVWTAAPRSLSAGDKSDYQDIFDPVVKKNMKKVIYDTIQNHKDNPYCLGYVSIDLPIWVVSPRNIMSYVDFMRSLEKGQAGKEAYLVFLRSKYENKWDEFSRKYGLQVSSYEDLIHENLKGVSAKTSPLIAAEDLEFLLIIAKEYYEFVSGAFRELAPNHLYLGDRLMAIPEDNRPFVKTPDEILKIAAQYVDVISFQPMGTRNLIRDYLNHVAEITGKPILLADVNCFHTRPAEGQTDTREYETQTGEHTVKYYLNAIENKNLIGIHRCTVRDFRPWDTRYHRRGILKADDTPYPILEEYTMQASQEVFRKVYPE
jgi:hypothetical protein